MRASRTPARILTTVLVAGTLLLSGCASSAGSPEPAPTTSDAMVTPEHADGFGLPSGDGPVQVQLWTDLSCPYCQQLEAATGEIIADAVSDGEVTFTIHPLNFVSGKHGDATDWSTRAANALAGAVNAGEAEHLPEFYALLQQNQTLEDGTHPSDENLLTIAHQAGIMSDLSEVIASLRYGPWVAASNDHWLGSTIAGTDQVIKGVPILVVDGAVLDLEAGDVQSALRAAIAAGKG